MHVVKIVQAAVLIVAPVIAQDAVRLNPASPITLFETQRIAQITSLSQELQRLDARRQQTDPGYWAYEVQEKAHSIGQALDDEDQATRAWRGLLESDEEEQAFWRRQEASVRVNEARQKLLAAKLGLKRARQFSEKDRQDMEIEITTKRAVLAAWERVHRAAGDHQEFVDGDRDQRELLSDPKQNVKEK